MENIRDYLNKEINVIIDRPLGTKHPKYDFIYLINYWYIPHTLAWDGEEIDAYILWVFEPVHEFKGKCVAIIHRINDNDDKLIIVPKDKYYNDEQIKALTEFQERFFQSKIIR